MAETRAGKLQCNVLGWVTKDAEPAGRRKEGCYYASRNGRHRKMTRGSVIKETISKSRVDEKQRVKLRLL